MRIFSAGPPKVQRFRLSSGHTSRLLEHFGAGAPARTAAELVRVNRKSARLVYHPSSNQLVHPLERISAVGEIEGDQVTLGAIVKGSVGVGPQAKSQSSPFSIGAAWWRSRFSP